MRKVFRSKVIVAVAALLLLLPVFWAPRHTCMVRMAQSPCMGCLWAVVNIALISVLLAVGMPGKGILAFENGFVREASLARPHPIGRAPPTFAN